MRLIILILLSLTVSAKDVVFGASPALIQGEEFILYNQNDEDYYFEIAGMDAAPSNGIIKAGSQERINIKPEKGIVSVHFQAQGEKVSIVPSLQLRVEPGIWGKILKFYRFLKRILQDRLIQHRSQ